MATLLGHIEHFDPAVEQWTQYVERLEQFFVANDVTGDDKAVKRRATFLSVVGRDAYNLLRSLIAPEKPTEKTFEQLVAVLTEHYSPKPTEVMQRFRFNSRARKEGESVAEYVAELRKLTEFCNYGVALNKMLRDRLVWGVKNASIQKKLLGESDLTLDRAIQIAQSTETAEQNLREMDGEAHKVVQYMSKKQNSAKRGENSANKREGFQREDRGSRRDQCCFRCGKTGHNEWDCFYKDSVCHKCKNRSHLAKMCKKSSGGSRSRETVTTRGGGNKKWQHVRQVEESDTSSEGEELAVHS